MTTTTVVALHPKGRSALLLKYYQYLRNNYPLFRRTILKCYLREVASLFTDTGLPDPRCSDSNSSPPSVYQSIPAPAKLGSQGEQTGSPYRGHGLLAPHAYRHAFVLFRGTLLHKLDCPWAFHWFHVSEYAQLSPKIKFFPQNPSFKGLPQVFILGDFTLHHSARRSPLPPSRYSEATLVRICWRK